MRGFVMGERGAKEIRAERGARPGECGCPLSDMQHDKRCAVGARGRNARLPLRTATKIPPRCREDARGKL